MLTEEIAEEIRGVLNALDAFCPHSKYGPPDCAPGTETETIDTLLAELGGWLDIYKDRLDYDPYNPSRCHRTPAKN